MEGIAGRQDGRGTQMLESLLLASGSSSSSTGATGRALSNTSARNRRRTNRHCYQNDLQINGQVILKTLYLSSLVLTILFSFS